MATIGYLWFLLSLNFIGHTLGLDFSRNTRLPENVIPESYNLDLSIDPDRRESFEGSVNVKVKIVAETDKIVLHAGDNLNINTISVRTIPELEEITTTFNNGKNEADFLIIKLDQALKSNQECSIKIVYNGTYGDNFGIYWKSYNNSLNKNEEYFVVTHFQSDHAREAFPCFDEPALKADFTVTVRHPAEYTTISNMDVKLPQIMGPKKGWKSTTFNRTPKMSTYLLAIFVSKFGSINNQNDSSAIYKKFTEVYARPHDLDKVKPILEMTQKCLVTFEKYLDSEYRLPKMSVALIPDNHHLGMENWGLIVLNEPRFITGNTDCNQNCKDLMKSVVCHEVIHMWFGNEATLNWWDSIWINEGFTTYLAQRSFNIMGETNSLEGINSITNIMAIYDKRIARIPITAKITNETTISELFGEDDYLKYSTIIRMLREIVGEETFQNTLRSYIKKYSGKSVSPENVLEEFQIATDNKFRPEMFSAWLNAPGYPILNAIQRPNSTIVDLFQTQHPDFKITETKWYIPLNWATKSNPNFEDNTALKWMKPDENSTIQLERENDWFIINKGYMGYYQVYYDLKNWEKVSKALKGDNFSSIDVMTRTQIIYDALIPINGDEPDYKMILDLIGYLKKEYEIQPFIPAFVLINKIKQYADNLKHYDRFEIFSQNLMEQIFKGIDVDSVKFESTSIYENFPVKLITILGCNVNSEHAHRIEKKIITDMFKNDKKGIFLLYPDVPCCGMLDSDEDLWNYALQEYKDADDSGKKTIFKNALICPQNEEIIKRLYNFMIDPSDDKINGSAILESLIRTEPKNVSYLMDFLNDNSQKFIELHGTTNLKLLIENLIAVKKSDTIMEKSKRNNLYETYRGIFSDDDQAKVETILAESNETINAPLHEIDLWLLENVDEIKSKYV